MNSPAGVTIAMKRFVLGPFATNCYVLHAHTDTDHRPAWVIDAGFAPDAMIEHARESALDVERILLTHAHVDHIAGLTAIRAAFPNAVTAIHADEADWLTDPVLNLSADLPPDAGGPVKDRAPDETLRDGQTLHLAGVEFDVLHTPGHSPGGVAFHAPSLNLAIVGDTLFNGSVGRSDFPTSSPAQLEQSIRERLYTLPPQTAVYPGHGEPTTIEHEMATNPFVRA